MSNGRGASAAGPDAAAAQAGGGHEALHMSFAT